MWGNGFVVSNTVMESIVFSTKIDMTDCGIKIFSKATASCTTTMATNTMVTGSKTNVKEKVVTLFLLAPIMTENGKMTPKTERALSIGGMVPPIQATLWTTCDMAKARTTMPTTKNISAIGRMTCKTDKEYINFRTAIRTKAHM